MGKMKSIAIASAYYENIAHDLGKKIRTDNEIPSSFKRVALDRAKAKLIEGYHHG